MRVGRGKSGLLFALVSGLMVPCGVAAEPATKPAAAPKLSADQQYNQAVDKAVTYLRTKGQAADGSFSAQAGPAVTALVVAGLIKTGRSVDDPMVAKALKYLDGFIQPDGGVYAKGSRHQNYETCVAIEAYAAANKDHRYDKTVEKADAFVRGIQWDTSKGVDKANVKFGGAGYGGENSRPDLSNTTFLIDALKSAGAKSDDEALQNALIFVSRCQNLETEYNTTPFAAKNPDGGFYYTAAGDAGNPAGKTENGGLRSYGSMTYAGLRSMIFAGVAPDDPRVKAAHKWATDHYDLASNPGMGSAGLYYYYHTFGKALDAIGEDEITDAEGKKHNWRQELLAALAERQKPDGSWVNDNTRWLEADANLVTGYVLLTLAHAKPHK